MKESDMMNNTNTHACMQAEVNLVFTHMHKNKVIKFFGEISIAEIINEFKKLDEGAMKGNPVVITLNTDELTDAESSQSLEAVNLVNLKRSGIIKGIT